MTSFGLAIVGDLSGHSQRQGKANRPSSGDSSPSHGRSRTMSVDPMKGGDINDDQEVSRHLRSRRSAGRRDSRSGCRDVPSRVSGHDGGRRPAPPGNRTVPGEGARAKRRGHLAPRPTAPAATRTSAGRISTTGSTAWSERGWCPPGRMNAPGGHRPGAPDGRRLHRGPVLRRSGRRITSVINGAMTSRVLRDTRPACAWRLRRVQGHREQPPRGRTGKNYCRQAP
jgi:hypothetical protein